MEPTRLTTALDRTVPRRQANPAQRLPVYDEAQRLLTEDEAPIISMFVTTKSMLVKPYVHGFHLNAMELLYLKKIKLVK